MDGVVRVGPHRPCSNGILPFEVMTYNYIIAKCVNTLCAK